MFSLPWWMYIALFGVIFSAYMVVRTGRRERQIEEEFIEKEGQVFIERMNVERENRINRAEPM